MFWILGLLLFDVVVGSSGQASPTAIPVNITTNLPTLEVTSNLLVLNTSSNSTTNPATLTPTVITLTTSTDDGKTQSPQTATITESANSTTQIIPMTTESSISKEPKNCEERLLFVDSCIKRIVLIGDREAVIPKTIQELEDNHCNRIKGELLCVRDYGKTCLKLFPRTIFTIVRKNVERVYKTLCNTIEGKTTAVKHFNCFKPDNLIVLHSIVDRITTSLEYIQFNVTDTEMLPFLCCAFYTFYHETKIIVDDMCLNVTGPETSDFVVNIVRAVVTDALDLGCGRYGSYDKCTQNLPNSVKIFSNILRLNSTLEVIHHNDTMKGTPLSFQVTSKKYSPVVPMIGISKRLDSGF